MRVAWVVGDNTDRMIPKATTLSVVNEKKRKLFLNDYATSRPLDWDRIKKWRKSSSERAINCTFDYDQFFQVYSKIRTEDADRKSNDTIVVLTPTPGLERCENQPLKRLLQKIKGLIPRHSNPLVGEVERQLKKRGPLANVVKDCVTVVSEAKTVIEPGPMQHLTGGDTSFHRWPVPDIAYQHVATIKADEAHRLFPSEVEAVSLEEADADAEHRQSEVDQALERDDLVIPYPHDSLHYFAMEVLSTFYADVMVIFSVASGAIAKAVSVSRLMAHVACLTLGAGAGPSTHDALIQQPVHTMFEKGRDSESACIKYMWVLFTGCVASCTCHCLLLVHWCRKRYTSNRSHQWTFKDEKIVELYLQTLTVAELKGVAEGIGYQMDSSRLTIHMLMQMIMSAATQAQKEQFKVQALINDSGRPFQGPTTKL